VSAKYGVGCGKGRDVPFGTLCTLFRPIGRNLRREQAREPEKLSLPLGILLAGGRTNPTYAYNASVSLRLGRVQVFVFRSGGGFRRGGGYRWSSGGEAEAVQNFSSRLRRMNRRKNSHSAAATRAQQNVNCKHSSHEQRPGIVASLRKRSCGILGLGFRIAIAMEIGQRNIIADCYFRLDRLGNDQRSPFGSWGKNPVKPLM
jgi:hypothetical protein